MSEYQLTELGEIPKDWDISDIADIGNVITGSTPKTADKENYGNEYLFVSPIDLGTFKYVSTTQKQLSKKGFNKTRHIPKGSILVTCIGSTIGKVGVAKKELSTNQQINSIACYNICYNEFIYYTIEYNFKNYRKYISNQAVPIIKKSLFSEFPIQLPPLIEQQKIAAILSSVDEAIEKTEQIIKQTEKVKKGMMQQLLTKGFGHTKFKETPIGEIPEEWEVLKQGDVATFFNGRAYKQKEFVKEGTPVVRIQNLTGGGNYVYSNLELNKNKYISTGDLVYAWSATFGPYIWQGPEAIYHYHIWKIECGNKIDKMFFYYRLHFLSNESNNQKSGAVFAHLTKSFMESYEIALPPINEQEKIVTILGSIDKKITSEEQKCVKLKFLKQGLMQDLLTGKVRVPIDNEEVVET